MSSFPRLGEVRTGAQPHSRHSRRSGNPERFSPSNQGRVCRNVPSELVSEVQGYNDIRIVCAIEDRIVLFTSNIP